MNLNERVNQFQKYLCYRIEKLMMKEKGGDSIDGAIVAKYQINNNNTADIIVIITNDNSAKMTFTTNISLHEFADSRYIPSITMEKVHFTVEDIRKSNSNNYFVFMKTDNDPSDIYIFIKNNKLDVVDTCRLFMNDIVYVVSAKDEPKEEDFFAYKIIIE